MRSLKLTLILTALLTAFAVCSCTTPGYVIEESNYSVKQHRIAVTAALGPVRAVSPNGREMYSFYHDRALKNIEVTPKTKERLYTKVVILGARRPYRMTVEVHIEVRDPDSKRFQDVGREPDLARKRAMAIKQMLNQSREEDGTFDEELPF